MLSDLFAVSSDDEDIMKHLKEFKEIAERTKEKKNKTWQERISWVPENLWKKKERLTKEAEKAREDAVRIWNSEEMKDFRTVIENCFGIDMNDGFGGDWYYGKFIWGKEEDSHKPQLYTWIALKHDGDILQKITLNPSESEVLEKAELKVKIYRTIKQKYWGYKQMIYKTEKEIWREE